MLFVGVVWLGVEIVVIGEGSDVKGWEGGYMGVAASCELLIR